MKTRFLLLVFTLFSLCVQAQNEDAAGSILISPTSMVNYDNPTFSTSQCNGTLYNLGSSTSPQTPAGGAGSMNNDVWFHFVADAEVAKIKVCNVSNFNVTLELWNANATGTALASANNNGVGAKEVICASALVVGNTYKVRVGRADNTGAGTFGIMYEHLAVGIRNNYYPGPSPATCYNLTTFFKRTQLNFTQGVGQTRWKFVDAQGNIYGPYVTDTNLNSFNLANGICETLGSVVAYVEIQANDPDCGNIWWGYSIGRTLNICGIGCPAITAGTATCGGTYCNIFSTLFETSFVGNGLQYQFRFVTDNGQTEFITSWSTASSFSTASLPYTNYFRYGKIYQVYVRAKRCNNNPAWCGPCTFSTCGFPYPNITTTNEFNLQPNYCVWRNKQGPFIAATAISGMDQYRFRLMPVDPCASNPFLPTGGAITTGWGSSAYFSPNSYAIPLGQVYILQAQCRVLPSNYINANGQTATIPGQQSDWSWPCFIGFRNSASPPEYTPLSCCFPLPNAGMLPDEVWGENRWTEFYVTEDEPATPAIPGKISLLYVQGSEIQFNTSESLQAGTALLELYNMNGQLVHSEQIAAVHEKEVITVYTQEELPGGIYLVSLSTPGGIATGKMFLTQ